MTRDASFGRDLQSNVAAIETHTATGIDFMARSADFIKRRIAIENDYAKALRKLADSASDSKRKQSNQSDNALYSLETAWIHLVESTDATSKIHALMAQFLEGEVVGEIRAQAKTIEAERKQHLAGIKQLKQDYKKQVEVLERVKKSYEQACKQADDARCAYEKADRDINVTKGTVDRLSEEAKQKVKRAEDADNEYQQVLELTNEKQRSLYDEDLIVAVDAFQTMEENRIQFMKAALFKCVGAMAGCLPKLNTALTKVAKSVDGIDKHADSLKFIELNRSGETASPYQEIPYENYYDKRRLKATKTKAPESDVTSMSPDIGLPKAVSLLEDVSRELDDKEKERAGMKTLMDAYSKQFSDPQTLMELRGRIDEVEKQVDVLRLKKYKYECYVAKCNNDQPPVAPTLYADAKPGPMAQHLRNSILGKLTENLFGSVSRSNSMSSSRGSVLSRTGTFFNRNNKPAIPRSPSNLISPSRPETPTDQKIVIALHTFQGSMEKDELPFEVGEQMIVIREDPSGWWLAKNMNGQRGYIPQNYVRVTE